MIYRNSHSQQCSRRIIQSQPYLARTPKGEASALAPTPKQNAVASGGYRAEKHKSAEGALASIL